MKSIKHLALSALAALSIGVFLPSCGGQKPAPEDVATSVASAGNTDETNRNGDSMEAAPQAAGTGANIATPSAAPQAQQPSGGTATQATEPDSAALSYAGEASAYVPTPGQVVPGSLICLTFDDGPNNRATPKVLDVLKKYGAHATFFCVGSCINSSTVPVMQRAVAEGNEIASHTYSHPQLSKCSREKRLEEMRKTNELIKNAVGYYPNFYRPPYLDCSKSVLADIDMPAVSGSASDDWITSHSPETIVATVLKTAKPGAIYVMHDLAANTRTPVALETLIPRLQELGYTLVTVSDLFASLGVTPQAHHLYVSPNRVTQKADSAPAAKPAASGQGAAASGQSTAPSKQGAASPAASSPAAKADSASAQ